MNTEQHLVTLEEEIKALKANYPLAASNMRFYVTSSEVFSVSGQPTARFKFTPNYGGGKNIFVNLRAIINIGSNPVGYSPQVNEPQDGSGDVVIQVKFDQYSSSTVYSVQIVASGANTGTFAML